MGQPLYSNFFLPCESHLLNYYYFILAQEEPQPEQGVNETTAKDSSSGEDSNPFKSGLFMEMVNDFKRL